VGAIDQIGSRYGLLVLAKVALLAALGLLGLAHRRFVIRRLEGGSSVRVLLWRLVLVELAVMGAVSGVASALASTPTPVPDEPPPAPTPAQIVTGHLLPGAPPP
jgi:putative copper export protein